LPRQRGFAPARHQAGSRRVTQWVLGPGADDQLTFDAILVSSSVTEIFGSGVEALEKFTIVRLRGFLNVVLLTTDITGGGFNWTAGIGIVSADAFSTGVAAMPDPFDDIDWPGWLWVQMGAAISPVAAAGRENNFTFPIDSKSMRKLG